MTKFLEKLKKPSFLAILDQICPFLGKMNFPEKLGSARFYLQSSTTIQKSSVVTKENFKPTERRSDNGNFIGTGAFHCVEIQTSIYVLLILAWNFFFSKFDTPIK